MAVSRRELRGDLRDRTNGRSNGGGPPLPPGPPGPPTPTSRARRPRRPKIKKLRLAFILAGIGLLAFVSIIFGMMMAVATDLQPFENETQFRAAQNSTVLDAQGNLIGTLTGNKNRILLKSEQISQNMKQAVVAIEDKRFYQHHGVDFQGIGRALVQDVLSRSGKQGGSTITEQLVKDVEEAQNKRTVFEKLREASLAYHLEKHWTKDKILTTYLNRIYFGEGAYGIEAAAQTYFGKFHPGCGTDPGQDPCASLLQPEEAAMLAGIISSPSAWDPKMHPQAALERRNKVLNNMYAQGVITLPDLKSAASKALPAPSQIEPPPDDSKAPYFTSWLRQQVVDRYGAARAFAGGLKIKSTLDMSVQAAAEHAISNRLSGVAPTGSAVVIDNATGAIKAMVGGFDFQHHPFNLATNGHRQPGSAFKPFTLITALEKGHSPNEVFTSQQKEFKVPHSPGEKFVVHNYHDAYAGSRTLTAATTYSDNSVYAELGLDMGTKSIAKTAKLMGVKTRVSTNPAMILGALKKGVTPLEMAYAYSTIAHDGQRIEGTLGGDKGTSGPTAIQQVTFPSGKVKKNKPKFVRVIPESVDHTAIGILQTVISSGTARRAQIGGFAWGKTGTTENNGDAWFCGATHEITACVWVGHADSNQPMETEFGGQPVDGGTFPAEIWHDIVVAYQGILNGREAASQPAPTYSAPAYSAPAAPAPQQQQPAPQQQAPAGGGGNGGGGGGGGTGGGAGGGGTGGGNP